MTSLRPSLLASLALLTACGARTPFYERPTDASASLDASDVPDVLDGSDVTDVLDVTDVSDVSDVRDVSDVPDVLDVSDVPDGSDVSTCTEGLPCTEGIAPCVLGRTRCAAGRSVCVEAGNELPGTTCAGGVCDGRGTCRRGDQRSCPMPSENGCGVVFLTGGTFTLGSERGYRASPAQPSITVSAFTLDAYEVTVARFRRFWEAGHPAPAGNAVTYASGSVTLPGPVTEPTATPGTSDNCNWSDPARTFHPVNCVDWSTAQAFCAWDGGRLPTEAEWEFAARQAPGAGLAANRTFPWGEDVPGDGCDRAQWNRCMGASGASTRVVGTFAASAGLFDLAGNVWEWTGDLFALYSDTTCWGGRTRTDPRCGTNASGYPAIRGGSWFSVDRLLLQGAARDDAYRPENHSALVGFRCARPR